MDMLYVPILLFLLLMQPSLFSSLHYNPYYDRRLYALKNNSHSHVSSSSVNSDGDGEEMQSEFMEVHNRARAEVGVEALVWDENVAAYARWWANERRVNGECELQHSQGPYGENIFWGGGEWWEAKEAWGVWVEEKAWYDYDGNSCEEGRECGHYTQVVWKTSCRIGCARAVCPNAVFITCNYHPPGNYIGQRPY